MWLEIDQCCAFLSIMSLLGVPVTCVPLFVSSPTCSLLRPEVTPAPLLTGVECLTAWQIRRHTQVMSPTSVSTPTTSTRRSTPRQQQEFYRANTTPPKSPPQRTPKRLQHSGASSSNKLTPASRVSHSVRIIRELPLEADGGL